MNRYLQIDLRNEFNHKAILEDKSLAAETGLTEVAIGNQETFFIASYLPESFEVF